MELYTINRITYRGIEIPLATQIKFDLEKLNEYAKYLTDKELAFYVIYLSILKAREENEEIKWKNVFAAKI